MMLQPATGLKKAMNDEALSEQHFAIIQEIAQKEAGLLLPASKRAMVQSRLSRRIRTIGYDNIPAYISLLAADHEERSALISVLTTNVTSFFREVHHFHTLAKEALPPFLDRAQKGERIRIWSAGCSTGEEAYSLAMLLKKLAPNVCGLDVRILATDIDRTVLQTAREGVYRKDSLDNMPDGLSGKTDFEPADTGSVSMPKALKGLISFKHLNLHANWPMSGAFDIIMCRNVVIYFDAAHQAALWPRFYNALTAPGWFFLGHSERIHPLEGSGFIGAGLTTYRKDIATGHPKTGKGA